MTEKKIPQKHPDRVEKEAEALRRNLKKRKIQIERRAALKKQKKDSDLQKN